MKTELLKSYLETENCTKLICAANNENYIQITNLVALYSMAGCRFFDINASIEAINAYKKGIEFSKKNDCCLCLSVGVDSDPHLAKCKIDKNLCTLCKKCYNLCPNSAIDDSIKIDEKKCIGCLLCKNNCPNNAIIKYQKSTPWQKNFELLKKECDCIEFHILSENINEIDEKWKFLCDNFDGYLSISVNHSLFSSVKLVEQLKKMLYIRKPKTTIIQADGIPMSALDNEYRTTIQAVAMTDFIQRADLDVYINTSGGTNSTTRKIMDDFKIKTNGISIGSYARKIVKDYINDKNFLNDESNFKKALKLAVELVNSTKKQ